MQRLAASCLPRAVGRRRRAGKAFGPATCLVLLLAFHPVSATMPPAIPSPDATAAQAKDPPVAHPKRADFQQVSASPEVKHVANWVMDSGDNGGLPYLVVDKINAKVFVFDASGRLQGAEPALLGMVPGDGTADGIGDQKLSAIRPEDRTTPAGRFQAALDRDLQGQSILWIDYASALALHRVVKGKPTERRAQRLQSETPEDNRISYGCINVPVRFFEKVVVPVFGKSGGIVYILPEMGAARTLFGSYDVDTAAQRAPDPH
jgi:hypothetical protein